MSSAKPNWASVSGRVEAVREDPDGDLRLRLHLDAAEDVPGFDNLVAQVVGESILVDLAPGAGATPAPGDALRARVRLTGPGRYRADPDSVGLG